MITFLRILSIVLVMAGFGAGVISWKKFSTNDFTSAYRIEGLGTLFVTGGYLLMWLSTLVK